MHSLVPAIEVTGLRAAIGRMVIVYAHSSISIERREAGRT